MFLMLLPMPAISAAAWRLMGWLQLEKEVQREKALAEAEGRAEERRRNKDIYRE